MLERSPFVPSITLRLVRHTQGMLSNRISRVSLQAKAGRKSGPKAGFCRVKSGFCREMPGLAGQLPSRRAAARQEQAGSVGPPGSSRLLGLTHTEMSAQKNSWH